MKRFTLLVAALFTSGIAFSQNFTLASSTLQGQATSTEEFGGFGCEGENKSPELHWMNAPEGTQSFAITMYDPDAPTGSGWWHWLVLDIPSDVTSLPQGAGEKEGTVLPKGAIQTLTDYGFAGYGGPCPPPGHGFHTYIITVYALPDASLGLTSETNAAVVGYNLNAKALAKASIVAYYKRD